MNDMASLLPTSAKFHFTNKLRNTKLEYSLNYFTKCKLYLGCIKSKALMSRRDTSVHRDTFSSDGKFPE